MGQAATEPRSRRSKRAALAVVLVLAAAGSESGIAWAQPASESLSCESDPLCSNRVERAEICEREGNVKGAILLYKLAYKERPDPQLLYRLARLHQKQGQLSEAADAYRAFLAQPGQDEEPRRQAQAFLVQSAQARSPLSLDLNSKRPPAPKPGQVLLITGGIFLGSGALKLAISGILIPQGDLDLNIFVSLPLIISGSLNLATGLPMLIVGGVKNHRAALAATPAE